MFRGAAPESAQPETSPDPAAPDDRSFPRIERAESDVLRATARPGGVFQLDGVTLAVGQSVRVEAPELFEAVVVCRINESHVAACSSECPLDASDLLYRTSADGLVCPSCRSVWRMDGARLSGPARYDIASYVVDAYDDALRIHDR